MKWYWHINPLKTDMFDQFVESGLKGLIDWVNWLDQWSNYADQLTEFYIMGVLVSNERTWETNAATTSTQSFKSSQVKGKDLHSPASWMKIFPKAFWQPHIWSVTPLRVHNIFNDMCNLLTKNHLEKKSMFLVFPTFWCCMKLKHAVIILLHK